MQHKDKKKNPWQVKQNDCHIGGMTKRQFFKLFKIFKNQPIHKLMEWRVGENSIILMLPTEKSQALENSDQTTGWLT